VLILSAILHWLISESLFLVRITTLDSDKIYDDSVSAMGYSPLAMTFSCIVCFLMLTLVNVKVFQKYRPGIPLAGSCSAAVSAACHTPRGEEDISTKAVRWGVVRGAGESVRAWKNKDKDFGHCLFSSLATAPPIPGRYYAGERESYSGIYGSLKNMLVNSDHFGSIHLEENG
jgi:hypothetical protein